MTNKELLETLLRKNVQLFGEDARSTLDLKRQLREIEERLTRNDHPPEILQFSRRVPKGETPKRCKV